MRVSDWEKKYQIILADPPWNYYGSTTGMGDAAKFYKLMADEDLLKLPLSNLYLDRTILFLWATSPRLNFALECIQAWNLYYRGIAFVWVKTTKDGYPLGAQGVRPSIVKPITEYVLAASTISLGRPLPLYSESIRQTIFAPKREHSQKPNEVQENIEEMYPYASKIELFAREEREGWDSWGDEL